MRNQFVLALTGGLLAVSASVPALAADRDELPTMSTYVSLHFGQTTNWQEKLRVGFRMDHNNEYTRRSGLVLQPIAQVDMNTRAFSAKLNGKDLLHKNYMLTQAEGAAGGWTFANYTWVDWMLVGIGAVAVGGGVYELAESDDPAPVVQTTTNTTSTTGALITVITETINGVVNAITTVTEVLDSSGLPTGQVTTVVTNGLGQVISSVTTGLGGLGGNTLNAAPGMVVLERDDPATLEWLNSGSGQMGDLIPQH